MQRCKDMKQAVWSVRIQNLSEQTTLSNASTQPQRDREKTGGRFVWKRKNVRQGPTPREWDSYVFIGTISATIAPLSQNLDPAVRKRGGFLIHESSPDALSGSIVDVGDVFWCDVIGFFFFFFWLHKVASSSPMCSLSKKQPQCKTRTIRYALRKPADL